MKFTTQVQLIWIGRSKPQEIDSLCQDFVKRIKSYCSFEIKEIKSLESDKNKNQLLTLLEDSNLTVLLDENGLEMNSNQLSNWLQTKFESHRKISFLIGDAEGHPDWLREKSDHSLSLSKMTTTHQIVRVLFCEQLYRALTIMTGHPYHNN